MKNAYEVRGEVTAIKINSKHGELEALISTNKLNIASTFPNAWCVQLNKRTNSFYVMSRSKKLGRVYLHRWITSADKGMEVDHRNHKTLDNTDFNLRVVTKSQNMSNLKGLRPDNSSGFQGISWSKSRNKWVAYFSINKKRKEVGCFADIEKAKSSLSEAKRKAA